MHRIDTKTAQKDKFGAGKNGFTSGNPQTGTPATDLDDEYFDMLQEELCSVVEASGASLEKARHDQLLTALRALLLSRKNPFGDIKSDGTVKTALENLGLGDLVNALIKTNNLSDLQDKALSRGNLGVPKGVDAQMVQARVHFNGLSGTIISGFNISSITKLGAGRYTVNFTTPLPNANYTATSSAWNTGGWIVSLARIAGVDSRTATNFGVSCMDNTSDEYADSSNIDVIVVGGV